MPGGSGLDLVYTADPLLGERLSVPAQSTNGTHDTWNVTLTGGAGNDTLFGFGGPGNWPAFNPTGDALHPLTVLNTVTGGAGNDALYSSFRLPGLSPAQQAIYSRTDTLLGGTGNDSHYLRDNNVTITDDSGPQGGIDIIFLTSSFTSNSGLNSFDMTLAAHVEKLTVQGVNPTLITGSDLDNVVRGNTGADTLYGQIGHDTLVGAGADDLLEGGDGEDALSGDGGMDTLRGDLGIDELFGGIGADLLQGGADNDLLFGGVAGDTLFGEAGLDKINGGNGADTLWGGDAADVLRGDAGSDLLQGEAGNDTLSGGTDRDSLYGGGDADILWGGSEKDQLYGDAGNDQLGGGTSNDQLYGGAGDDVLLGSAGSNDTMSGGDGNDRFTVFSTGDVVIEDSGMGTDTVLSTTISLYGAAYAQVEVLQLGGSTGHSLYGGGTVVTLIGNDGANLLTGAAADESLYGGSGNDTLSGALGNDALYGGAADDLLQTDLGLDTLSGGAGNDSFLINDASETLLVQNDTTLVVATIPTVYYVPQPGFTVLGPGPTGPSTLATVIELDGGGNDTISTLNVNLDGADFAFVEVLQALGDADVNLTAGAQTVLLRGNDGDNILTAAGAGITLDGGLGDDTLIGGDLDDWFVVDSFADSVVETEYTAHGMDTVASSDIDLWVENYYSAEALILLGSADLSLFGSSGFADNLTGNSGHNQIFGEADCDTLVGNDGNDTLEGGVGDDIMVGGEGDDVYVVNIETDTVTETGSAADFDTVSSGDIELFGAAFTGIEALLAFGVRPSELTGGGDVVLMTGNISYNLMIGGTASETMYGGEDTDTLSGNDGNDVLYGGTGSDTIDGGDGTDTITGGEGDDSLRGGALADLFVFDTFETGSTDQMMDFGTGADQVDLSALSIQALRSQAEGFLGGTQNSAIIEIGGSDSTILLDLDGDGTLDQTIFFFGSHDLLAPGILIL